LEDSFDLGTLIDQEIQLKRVNYWNQKKHKQKVTQKVRIQKLPEKKRLFKRCLEETASRESEGEEGPTNQALGKPIIMNHEEMSRRIREFQEVAHESSPSGKASKHLGHHFLSEEKNLEAMQDRQESLQIVTTTKDSKIIDDFELEFIDSYDCYLNNASLIDVWSVYYGQDYMDYFQLRLTEDAMPPATDAEADHSSHASAESKGRLNMDSQLGKQIFQSCVCSRKQLDADLPRQERKSDLTWEMRTILLDWMKEFCASYSLKKSTFHLAVTLLDEYCDKKDEYIEKSHVQLTGAICLLLASKIEVPLSDSGRHPLVLQLPLSGQHHRVRDEGQVDRTDHLQGMRYSPGAQLEDFSAHASLGSVEHLAQVGRVLPRRPRSAGLQPSRPLRKEERRLLPRHDCDFVPTVAPAHAASAMRTTSSTV